MAKSIKTEYVNLLKKSISSQGKEATLHAKRVKVFAGVIVDKIIELKLLPEQEYDKETLKMIPDACYFHDIGKINLNEDYRILPDIRTESGRFIYQTHVDEGFKIFDSIVHLEELPPKSATFFSQVLNCILEHHERYDGRGFPNKLVGQEIDIAGRICAVVDQLDNYLTTTRDKEKISLDLAIEKIQTHKDTRFDPIIVNALVFSKPELEDKIFVLENGSLSEKAGAIDKEKPMELLFRPIFDTLTRQVKSYEAVLKLYDRYYGSIYPAVYMAVAEKHDQIAAITEWSIKSLAKSYKRLVEREVKFEKLFINISTKYLAKKYSADKIIKILDENDVNPTKICVELNESILADLRIQVVESIDILRSRGISVALYNFGSEYSSLSKLEDLNINSLILSKDFTEQIVDSVKSREVVKAIVSLAKNLHYDIVTDGVESKSEEQIMKEVGVRDMLGNFYGNLKKERYLRSSGKVSGATV